MQRHKEPLSFAESPYDGTKHYTSPVLAAQRPFLASSISAELLNDQWVRNCYMYWQAADQDTIITFLLVPRETVSFVALKACC